MNKLIKRTILSIFILTVFGILFRGWFYRHLITYKSVGLRTYYYSTNEKLVNYINSNIDNQPNTDIEKIIKLGLSKTSRRLNFTIYKNEIDPKKLITSKTANCVGYATFFATTCNYLLEKNNLSDIWIAKPQVGQLYLLGVNIHNYFHSAFFKDHDFVTIENKKTGEIYAVDPTISEYLSIDFISYKNEN